MNDQVKRIVRRHQADLHPPLGRPGGPCQVVERIDKTIHNPNLKENLTDTVNDGHSLSNPDAAKIYPLTHEKGVGSLSHLAITSHAQYRMDLRGITIDDVKRAISSFLQKTGELRAKKHPAYDRYAQQLARGDKIEWIDPKTSLEIVFAANNGTVNLISTYWKGVPDPVPPHGGCTLPSRQADNMAERVAARFLSSV